MEGPLVNYNAIMAHGRATFLTHETNCVGKEGGECMGFIHGLKNSTMVPDNTQ